MKFNEFSRILYCNSQIQCDEVSVIFLFQHLNDLIVWPLDESDHIVTVRPVPELSSNLIQMNFIINYTEAWVLWIIHYDLIYFLLYYETFQIFHFILHINSYIPVFVGVKSHGLRRGINWTKWKFWHFFGRFCLFPWTFTCFLLIT